MDFFNEYFKLNKIGIKILILISFSISSQEKYNDDLDLKYETINLLKKVKSYKSLSIIIDSYGPYRIKKLYNLFEYIPCINPLNPDNKIIISSKFNKKRFHPIDKKYKKHLGIDLAVKIGTTVHSTASGTIKKVIFSDKGYGNYIIIKHDFGFETKYAHLSIILKYKKGEKVKRGDIIGMVGSSGKSTGNHLHYEIIKNRKHLDPALFFFLYKKIIF